jgi:hypothetical protein
VASAASASQLVMVSFFFIGFLELSLMFSLEPQTGCFAPRAVASPLVKAAAAGRAGLVLWNHCSRAK